MLGLDLCRPFIKTHGKAVGGGRGGVAHVKMLLHQPMRRRVTYLRKCRTLCADSYVEVCSHSGHIAWCVLHSTLCPSCFGQAAVFVPVWQLQKRTALCLLGPCEHKTYITYGLHLSKTGKLPPSLICSAVHSHCPASDSVLIMVGAILHEESYQHNSSAEQSITSTCHNGMTCAHSLIDQYKGCK